jgi:molybdate transport system regulatory protein
MSDTTRVAGRLWVNKGEHTFLGHGRVELLRNIAEHGSISAAARAMGMSYKAAWEAVDAMNNVSDEPLVVRSPGGKRGGGTRLTDHGFRTVELFRFMEGEYRRFLQRMGEGAGDFEHYYELMRRFALKTTARNQFSGVVEQLTRGAVNAEVTVKLSGGQRLVSIVSLESVDCLQLEEGREVYALIQESAVLLTPDSNIKVSARNVLSGTVVRCQEGAVNGEVRLELPCGKGITSIITNDSIRRLGIREGREMTALIKATDVMLAVND